MLKKNAFILIFIIACATGFLLYSNRNVILSILHIQLPSLPNFSLPPDLTTNIQRIISNPLFMTIAPLIAGAIPSLILLYMRTQEMKKTTELYQMRMGYMNKEVANLSNVNTSLTEQVQGYRGMATQTENQITSLQNQLYTQKTESERQLAQVQAEKNELERLFGNKYFPTVTCRVCGNQYAASLSFCPTCQTPQAMVK